jgi:3-hydroxyacyl-[acyl-carrier-protein] dehydratase
MRFCQLDKITQLEPGVRIIASKTLVGNEDYLRDHFPRFAVMPGVMMLESLYQAAALLARATEGYKSGLVLLRTAKNVKFADFLQPGQTLDICVELIKQEGQSFIFKGTGQKGGATAVSARLVVDCVPAKSNAEEIVAKHASLFMQQLTRQLQQAAMVPR